MPSLLVFTCALVFQMSLVQSIDKAPEKTINRTTEQRQMIEGQIIDPETNEPSWLVMLDADPRVTEPAQARAMVHEVLEQTIGSNRARFVYEYAVIGFSASMSAEEADQVANHPRVRHVEADMPMNTAGDDRFEGDPNEPTGWGLRRISDPDGLAPDFNPCGADGTGVTVVVIDSGIKLDQTEFTGRIRQAVNFVQDNDPSGNDTFGHGTHVAGIIAGTTTGVAPKAEIVALRVVGTNGGGSNSNTVAALNWVANPSNLSPPAVVNMSIGARIIGQQNFLIEEALELVKDRGFPMMAAALNNAYPASWVTPSGSASTFSVGSTDLGDMPSTFTNFGPQVSVWAPGGMILSADWQHPNGGIKFDSGTSMASPCAAGVAALFLQRHYTSEDGSVPSTMADRTYLSLIRNASPGVITDQTDPDYVSPGGNGTMGGAANRMLQACEGEYTLECDDAEQWYGESLSVLLGDGVTPITSEFACSREVWNPAGPVSITVNTTSTIPVMTNGQQTSNKATIKIIDAATSNVLWNSDDMIADSAWEKMANQTVTSSSNQGVTVTWSSNASEGTVGYGYAMTALVQGNCVGDIDGSGSVDGTELAILLADWGPCTPDVRCAADLNLDGIVDGADLTLLLSHWGPCPEWSTPGFIKDCNGNEVLASFLGDTYLDDGSRSFIRNPATAPTDYTYVDLDCPSLKWDTCDNGFVISETDPRIGACTLPSQDCIQTTLSDCTTQGGSFWGRDVSCDQAAGVFDTASFSCPSDMSSLGVPIDTDVGYFVTEVESGMYTYWRQEVPAGITSVSELVFFGIRSSWSSSRSNRSGVPGGPGTSHGFVQTDFDMRFQFFFRDGSEPVTVIRPINPVFLTDSELTLSFWYDLYVATDLLEEVPGREVKYISISSVPAPENVVSDLVNFLWGSKTVDMTSDELTAEFSPNGGRNWYPLDSTGERVQASLCIKP